MSGKQERRDNMRARTTRKFDFYKGKAYTNEDLERVGQFIADHLEFNTAGGVMPSDKATMKSTSNITITIDYEQQDTEIRDGI